MVETGEYARANERIHKEYLPFQKGKTFTSEDVYNFFQLQKYPPDKASKIKHAISEVLYNLSTVNKDKELVQDRKYYRLIDKTAEEVKWWESNEEMRELPLRLPMGLNDFCLLDSPCLIVIASPTNQGKTAFILDLISQNIYEGSPYNNKITLFESDPPEQLKRRFSKFEFPIPVPPPFKVYRRLSNFEDVIDPNGLNLVDYIRVDTQRMWAVQDTQLKILSKLGKDGIAVVALQKPPGRDLAYGKDFTAFDSTLYLSMESGKLKFVKIKTPKPMDGQDPYKFTICYKIKYGVQFYDIHREYGDESL